MQKTNVDIFDHVHVLDLLDASLHFLERAGRSVCPSVCYIFDEKEEKINVFHNETESDENTVDPRSKAPAYKAMFAYKAFEKN